MSKKLASVLSLVIVMVFAFFAVASSENPETVDEVNESYKEEIENREEGTDWHEYVDTAGNARVYKIEGGNVTIKDQNGKLTTFKDNAHTYYVNEELSITLYADGQISVTKIDEKNPENSYHYGKFYTDRSLLW